MYHCKRNFRKKKSLTVMALNLPLDKKLAASMHRRRIAENQRKQRIFDSKRRQIGIDTEALNYQVHESLLKKAKEEEIEKQYAEAVLRNDSLAKLLDQQKALELLEKNKKIDEYRMFAQKPEYQRDFDLYDPDLKKKERPPRVSKHDPCPVSNLQKLDGEDLDSNNRTKKQKDQTRDILLQQMLEKRLENVKKCKEKQEWEKRILDLDRHALKLREEELEKYKKNIVNLKRENKFQSLQNKEREMQHRIEEEIQNKKDIEYNFYGPLLNEETSMLNARGVMPDRYKGMSKEQLMAIYQEQVNQITENQRKKEEELLEKAIWDQQLINQTKMMSLMDEDEKKLKFDLSKNLESKNRELSKEQIHRNYFLNKVGFKNSISTDFFSQFNTSSR